MAAVWRSRVGLLFFYEGKLHAIGARKNNTKIGSWPLMFDRTLMHVRFSRINVEARTVPPISKYIRKI